MKYLVTLSLFFISLLSHSQTKKNKRTGASGFYFEEFNQTAKLKEGETYLKAVSDSSGVANYLSMPKQFGMGMGFVYLVESVEFEFGMAIKPKTWALAKNEVSNGTTTLGLTWSGVDYKMGMNIYPAKAPFFMGMMLCSNAYNWNLSVKSSAPNIQSKFQNGLGSGRVDFGNTTDFFGSDKQRILIVKLQAGFNLFLSKYDGHHLKINAYADYSLNKYNFINASDLFLNSYSGPGKSKFKGYGVRVALLFGQKNN